MVYDPQNASPYIINPARAPPELVKAHLFPGSKNPVVSLKTTEYHRAICFAVGLVLDCKIVNPTAFREKSCKQLLLAPLLGENARAMAFFGQVFGSPCLGIPTFGVGPQNEKMHGLSFRTMPLAPSSSSVNGA